MRRVFADTGYWIALNFEFDALHDAATNLEPFLQGCVVVTSEMVLTEFLDGCSEFGRRYREACTGFVRALQRDGVVQIVPNTAELFDNALILYEQRSDKEWSLTDCASFYICQQQGISEALAHDNHFAQAGIVALMRDPS